MAVEGGVRPASLEEREAVDEAQPLASGTAARMKTVPERSPLMNKSLLFMHWGSVDGGRRQVLGSPVFYSRSKHRDVEDFMNSICQM